MTIELTFYTTDGCHLCEDAKHILQNLMFASPGLFQIEVVDIIESDKLVETYGTRIPVVCLKGSNADLGWPFDYECLLRLLESAHE